jgi:lipid-A-disaccharide synthase
MAESAKRLQVAIVAAEASGDLLGAGLIEAIRARFPAARFFGVAGPGMRAAGCEAWHEAEDISVMGLAEVLPHLARLLRLRRGLIKRIASEQPDVFVGIDSPDFNLPLAAALKHAAIPTVQYVSPQVWAWRQSRVVTIRRSVDLVLCLLPFEVDFYVRHAVKAVFVGHPMAEDIPAPLDRMQARRGLGLEEQTPVLGVLPGSRRSELNRLARPFMQTAGWLQSEMADLQVAVALASPRLEQDFARATAGLSLRQPPSVSVGRARDVLAAADVVLTASGTASLEALLVGRPMVIAYRMSALSYWIVRRLGTARLHSYSLPNLLAGRRLVPEFVQGQVSPRILGPVLLDCFAGRQPGPGWQHEFERIHARLRGGGSETAARAILDLVPA